ncbi:hypothetical protein BLNAU_20963 [Blattamonas nauphoetae]|uniref:Uncharacterized protein n=1 Tax=Blattamonas nauphoetae TaxID=2049346 RepID=A0ABQ9WXA0_9EUKA|nr:hypothetical protein BLNAU_20963 [Blattamonas nauphoetae]
MLCDCGWSVSRRGDSISGKLGVLVLSQKLQIRFILLGLLHWLALLHHPFTSESAQNELFEIRIFIFDRHNALHASSRWMDAVECGLNWNTARNGGAVLFSCSAGGTSTISWFSCIFFNNTERVVKPITDDPAKNCLAGNDLCFYADTDDWNKTLAREGSFRDCFSTSDFTRIVIDTLGQHATHAIRFPMNATLLSALPPSPSLVVSVRDDGNDEAGCGMSCFLACKTLGDAGKNQLTFSTGEVLVEAWLLEERMGRLESFPGGSSTDSIPSVEVLILSADQIVTHSTMLSLLHITQHCPERLQEKHVETSRIPHLVITLNQQPLSSCRTLKTAPSLSKSKNVTSNRPFVGLTCADPPTLSPLSLPLLDIPCL